MLREMQAIGNKHAPTMYKAEAAMKTGMLVTIKDADGVVSLPTTATSKDLYWVTKERIPTGLNAARTEFSDYETEFNEIAVGEFVKLIPMQFGERYATDQFAEGLAVGDAVESVKGVATKATGDSNLKCVGTYVDNGHKLMIIRKV